MRISSEELRRIHIQVDDILNWKRWIRELEKLTPQNLQSRDDPEFISLIDDVKSTYNAKINQLFKFFEII